MKYLVFDAGPIISLTMNGINQKQYKLDFICSNTLSPQCYPRACWALFSPGGFYD